MAISEESYGRGNTVYSNGSQAPTRGTVDPTGYIKRSLAAPSQSRSGLAAAAVDRLKAQQPAQAPKSPGVVPIGDVKMLMITPTGRLVPQNGMPPPPPEPPAQPPDLGGMPPGPTGPPGPMSGNPLAIAALGRMLSQGGPQ